MNDLAYPIGKFQRPATISAEDRRRYLTDLTAAPACFREVVQGLDDSQIDTPYRPGGWTVRQVIHHVPDSHLNSYCRFRFALTEDDPAIKSYPEDKWAELHDARTQPLEPSLRLLEGLHTRWVSLLSSLSENDWKRTFRHPEMGSLRLDTTLALYSWHSLHHAAHIRNLRRRNGW
jgi:hypothetical protein